MRDPEDVLRSADEEMAKADRELARVRNLPKFRCPICGRTTIAKVLEGRMDYGSGHYWRRHECQACFNTYTTKQIVEAIDRPSIHSQHLVA